MSPPSRPGEVWGKNRLGFSNWDHLEQSGACLEKASVVSQFLEGDKYPTSSSVVPMLYKLMATSSVNHDVHFANRAADKFNDAQLNPIKVPHANLDTKVQAQRQLYHQNLIDRFDSDVPLATKKFWFTATKLDPRYKNLVFKNDNMITQARRRDAEKWLTEEFNKNYKGKFGTPNDPENDDGGSEPDETTTSQVMQRQKVSAASFMDSDEDEAPSEDEAVPIEDELKNNLALPQMKFKTDWGVLEWWREQSPKFPNLAVMARQYLGCPATSASVERLFSAVGIAFSDKRKSAHDETISNIMFARANI